MKKEYNMLTIKFIELIKGMQAFGYEVTGVTTKDKMKMGGDYYIFGFDKKYKDEIVEVYLNRHSEKKDGKYEMFVMGWGASTRIDVSLYDVRSPSECAFQIRQCLEFLEEKHQF